jgi:catechol 1,2-dioxygenase
MAMASTLVQSPEVQRLLDRIAGLDAPGGNPRRKQILRRIIADLFATIEEFDITPEEFWRTVSFLQQGAPEFGLIAPGLGFDHFLDIRLDLADKARGLVGGTPRTIEGPLYVAGAPLAKSKARLDDGSEKGDTLIMHGRVLDPSGRPLAGAIVDVWHANSMGAYSYFDPTQRAYNNRRRIETDDQGRYKFQSIVPSGYAVPPGGATERLLDSMGRHGRRPAHIHFFVSAAGHRHLTTQINIDGDPYLHDDFAYATRPELIPRIVRRDEREEIRQEGLDAPFSEIEFDFVLPQAADEAHAKLSVRSRVEHA